tara:strand:+ start:710 stop:1852 length:1143 start_codon:yes stop_codon:yes gene_type:complete
MSFFYNFLKKPSKKKFLIVNESGSEVLLREKIIDINNSYIINFKSKNYFNLWIIVYGLIYNYKLFKKSKYAWIIASLSYFVEPKYTITFMDYIFHFYYVKKYYPNSKYISIQVGRRNNEPGQFFDNLRKLSYKKEFFCDYILAYSKFHAIEYSKYIKCVSLNTGSIRSNSLKIKTNEQALDSILFISQFRSNFPKKRAVMIYDGYKVEHEQFFNAEIYVLKKILKFCQNKNLKLRILSSLKSLENEAINFYDNLIGRDNYEFINKLSNDQSYDIVDNHKFVCGIDSTLLYEALARKSRVGVFYTRKCFIEPLKNIKFGWPAKLNKNGLFWTHDIKEEEIYRVLNNLIYLSDNDWFLKTNDVISSVMHYDENNTIIKNLIK